MLIDLTFRCYDVTRIWIIGLAEHWKWSKIWTEKRAEDLFSSENAASAVLSLVHSDVVVARLQLLGDRWQERCFDFLTAVAEKEPSHRRTRLCQLSPPGVFLWGCCCAASPWAFPQPQPFCSTLNRWHRLKWAVHHEQMGSRRMPRGF